MDLITLAAGNWWYEFWNSMWLLVCQGIYFFVSALYQVYEKVASVNLFSREIFEEITGRLYIVIGVAMLFIFAYNLILMIINPEDKKGTSNMTKVVKETIMSLVLVILLPTIFNYLYVFQTHILESNIIGNIVLGNVGSTSANSENCDPTDYDCSCDFSSYKLDRYKGTVNYRILFWTVYSSVSNTNMNETEILSNGCKRYKEELTGSQRGAYSIAPTVFSAFYRPANFTFDECVTYLQTDGGPVASLTEEDQQICVNFFYDVTLSKYLGNTWGFTLDTYLKDIISDSSKNTMEFHWIMAVVAGILAVYMFFCYAMEIGVRVAKLGFLQLISPIPVMIKIIPEQKKVYDAWFKNLTKTYVDVFIRVAIIDFALFGISLVPDVISTMWTSTTTGDGNFFIKTLAIVFVILGILKFAQDAPALFKEFFGDAGTFKLRSPKQQLTDNKLAMGGLGMATGGIMGMAGNYYKSTHDENGNKIEGSTREGIASAAGGLIGGARRGAVHGSKAKDWESFKSEMNTSKAETDYARYKHNATRKDGADALGKDIPLVSGIVGTGIGIKSQLGDLVDYIKEDHSGSVQSASASAVKAALDKYKDGYHNAAMKGMESRRGTATDNLASGDDISFMNGNIYHQNKDDGLWYLNRDRGTDGKYSRAYTGKEMQDIIKEAYKEEERSLYANEFGKNPEAYKSYTNAILNKLNDNLTNLGSEFSSNLLKDLKKTLKDAGMDPDKLKSLSELPGTIDNLREEAIELQNKDDVKADDRWKLLYNINDNIDSNIKRTNAQLSAKAVESKK